jgi:hypothetical protein
MNTITPQHRITEFARGYFDGFESLPLGLADDRHHYRQGWFHGRKDVTCGLNPQPCYFNIQCKDCGGVGAMAGAHSEKVMNCPGCNGTGRL